MKTYAISTPSFEPLHEIFEKTAPRPGAQRDPIDARPKRFFKAMCGTSAYPKVHRFRDLIASHQGEIIALLRLDIQFFGPCESTSFRLGDNDMPFRLRLRGTSRKRSIRTQASPLCFANERTLALV